MALSIGVIHHEQKKEKMPRAYQTENRPLLFSSIYEIGLRSKVASLTSILPSLSILIRAGLLYKA